MDTRQLTRLERWRVCGIFATDRRSVLSHMANHLCHTAGLERVVYLHSEDSVPRLPADAIFVLQRMSRRHTDLLTAMEAISASTLLIVDDVENLQRFPISMTRNVINHLASRTRYKIVAGGSLLTHHMHDLYAPFHVLDRRILWASHYWCFKAQHREVSVFDGQTVRGNKELWYTAEKIKPFIYFDLSPAPDNELQVEFYECLECLRSAPLRERVQDVSELELEL